MWQTQDSQITILVNRQNYVSSPFVSKSIANRICRYFSNGRKWYLYTKIVWTRTQHAHTYEHIHTHTQIHAHARAQTHEIEIDGSIYIYARYRYIDAMHAFFVKKYMECRDMGEREKAKKEGGKQKNYTCIYIFTYFRNESLTNYL